MDKEKEREFIVRMRILQSMYVGRSVRLVGFTAPRSATIRDRFTEGDRKHIKFLEDVLDTKVNHVVVIFQVLNGNSMWRKGTYYALLTDDFCVIGNNMEDEGF